MPPNKRIIIRVYHPDFVESDFFLATTAEAQPIVTLERARTGHRLDRKCLVYSNESKIELSPGYRVSGQLLDESGKPIAHQKAILYRKTHNKWTRFETDSEGKFQSPCFEHSDIYLVVRSGDDVSWASIHRKIDFADGEFRKQLEFITTSKDKLFGIAKDDLGQPVEGIHVYFVPTNQMMGRSMSVMHIRKTDANGKFKIPCPVEPGRVYFGRSDKDLTYDLPTEMEVWMGHHAQGEQRYRTTKKFTPAFDVAGDQYRSSENLLEVTINRSPKITGRVVDAEGNPVANPVFELLNGERFKHDYGATLEITMPSATSNMGCLLYTSDAADE